MTLPAGKVLVDFTASTMNGNNVHFTISTLTPGRNYNIKKGSGNFMNKTADGSGTIAFDNSVWPSSAFTVQESEEQGSGSASDTAVHMNMTPIPNAVIFLYTQAGIPYDSTLSAANGTFQFNNVPVGSYYVNVSKTGFVSNQTVVTVTTGTVNAGILTLQYYDVNGDGAVNDADVDIVEQHLDISS